jgi:hypothetical protein
MKRMYWLVALIYAIGAVVAFLISFNPDNDSGFYWDTFWRFELTIPTIFAVLILLLGWGTSPPSAFRQ